MSTSSRKRARRRWIVFLSLAGLLVVAWALLAQPNKPTLSGPYASPKAAPETLKPSPSAVPKPNSSPGPRRGDTSASGPPSGSGPAVAPRHRVTMVVTAEGPVSSLAFAAPTAPQPNSGKLYNTASWSKTTVIYGNPGFTGIWVITGANSGRAVCSVTVDGKLVQRHVVTAQWAPLVCGSRA